MKKLPFLILLIMVFSCSSSDDNATFCWECKTHTTRTVTPDTPIFPKSEFTETTICDKTYKEIEAMMESQNKSFITNIGSFDIAITIRTDCKKKQ